MLTISNWASASSYQWDIIIEGMRNPMNSWDKQDSRWDAFGDADGYSFGDNDLALMRKLTKAGPDHRKFMRMIPVWITITAPLYWWKEFDTYKVGTTTNSCSTMHKIHAKDFVLDDFSHENLEELALGSLMETIKVMNVYRDLYIQTKEKRYWKQLIELLPTSYNQRRTVYLNYETLYNIYHARRNHKLNEWHTLCDFITKLPLAELITGGDTDV